MYLVIKRIFDVTFQSSCCKIKMYYLLTYYSQKSSSIQPRTSPPMFYPYVFSSQIFWCMYVMYSGPHSQACERIGSPTRTHRRCRMCTETVVIHENITKRLKRPLSRYQMLRLSKHCTTTKIGSHETTKVMRPPNDSESRHELLQHSVAYDKIWR